MSSEIVMNVRVSGGSEFFLSLALAPAPAPVRDTEQHLLTKVLPAGSSVLSPGLSLAVAAVPAQK